MPKIVTLIIPTCNKCPYVKTSRTPTPDSFDYALDYYCGKSNGKVIREYVGTFDGSVNIPTWCELENID